MSDLIKEIQEHIEDNRPWTAAKEIKLLVELGGGKIKAGRFYANPNYYKVYDRKIAKAKRGLGSSDKTYEEFIEENQDLL